MKKITTSTLTILIFGLIFTSLAIFAEILGVDKNPGTWSRSRIAFFMAGISLFFLAGIYSYAKKMLHIAFSRLELAIQKHQIVIQFLENKTIQHILKYVRKYVLTISILAAVLLFYAWFASSGTWTTWYSPTYYYSNLADAFIKGNLYLSIQPSPQLLALKNPYDPSTRSGIEIPVDLSLYDGKFYMYWGPAPAILLAVIQFFIHKQVGDFILTFVFVCGIFIAQSLLLFLIWNRYFFTLPKWTLYFSILLGGLTGPIILLRHNYENARIYEASIAGGQFFLLSGFLLAFYAITKAPLTNWGLTFTGVAWAFAIGTRQILAGPIGVMVILTTFQVMAQNAAPIVKMRKLILLGLPLFLGFICLSWYNWARFNSITETGLYYQLAGPYLREHYTELFSKSYILQNSYNYLFNPPDITSKFPFISMLKGNEKPILPLYTVPEFYNGQPVTGLMYLFPFAVFATLPLIALSRSLYTQGLADFILDSHDPTTSMWISLSLAGSLLIAYSLLLGFFWTGLRYLGDFIPELMILSALGFWQGYKFFMHKYPTNSLYILFGIFLAGASIFTSTMLAISTNSKMINLIIRKLHFLQ